MIVETKDMITWALGATTVAIGGLGVFLQIRRDVGERRRRQDENDRAWRIDALSAYDEGPWKGLHLVLTDPETHGCKLLSMKVLRPTGSELAIFDLANTSMTNSARTETKVKVRGQSIKVDRGLTKYRPGRGPSGIADMYFHVKLPDRPRWRQGQSVRAVIRLTVSDNSRTRRIRQICITSDEITVDSTKNPSVM